MTAGDWKTVNLKTGLAQEVERVLQGDTAKSLGITNVSQFVDASVKEKLERLERKRFDHINMYEDHVKILDNKLDRVGRIVSVYFRDTRAWCDYCDENLCVHIQYAWELPQVREILEKRGFTPPPSRIG